jgi:glycosyltransferase involved in cell wall biosynthesis
LQWHQGVDIAVRAFSKIVRKGLNAEFHIYGEGQAKRAITDLIGELGMERSIVMHDGIPLKQVAKVMKSADVGVVPKRGDTFGNEAFSTKILEFMACGVPVIAANTKIDLHYFNEEVVTFFKSGSEDDLAERLVQLLSSREKRRSQAAAAEELVRRRFSWEGAKIKYLNFVDDAVASRSTIKAPSSIGKDELRKFAGR